MKLLSITCGLLLLLAVAPLPIGYYTFLRIVVTLGAAILIIKDIEDGITVWAILFGLVAILFNPILPIYLQDKDIWIPLDIASAVLFFVKSLSIETLGD